MWTFLFPPMGSFLLVWDVNVFWNINPNFCPIFLANGNNFTHFLSKIIFPISPFIWSVSVCVERIYCRNVYNIFSNGIVVLLRQNLLLNYVNNSSYAFKRFFFTFNFFLSALWKWNNLTIDLNKETGRGLRELFWWLLSIFGQLEGDDNDRWNT